MSPGLQAAQAVHAAFQFATEWPTITTSWVQDSNFLVVVAVPDEEALAVLAGQAVEEGIARTIVREPDLGNTITAVALEPGHVAKKLCAQLPLALKGVAGEEARNDSLPLTGKVRPATLYGTAAKECVS